MRRQKYILDEDRDLYIKKEKPSLMVFFFFLFAVIWSKFFSWEGCICYFFFQYVIPEESPPYKNTQYNPSVLRIRL